MGTPELLQPNKRITQWILKLIYFDSYFSPIIFFTFITINELDLIPKKWGSYWVFTTGIIFFLLTCINHFYFMTAVLNQSLGNYSPLNILIGLLGANKRWKIYLLWFVIGYYVTSGSYDMKQIFIIVSACAACFECYQGLIFQTIWDNKIVFSGLFTLLIIHLAEFILKYTHQFRFTWIERACIGPLLFLLGLALINLRIQKVYHSKPEILRNPSLLVQYINILIENFEKEENIHSYMFTHKHECAKLQCYCHQYTEQKLIELGQKNLKALANSIINGIFLEIFKANSWDLEDKLILMHRYAQFLIQAKQIPLVVSVLTHAQEESMGYFNKCQNYLVRQKLQQSFEHQIYFDNKQTKLCYLYNYDLQVGYVNKEIRQILQNKIEFWKELCKENPMLKEMQVMGRKLVERIESLHQYFSYKIRPCEQYLTVINCTIMYASYLLLTTNYLEFANSLVKKAQKLVEQKKGEVNNGIQFGLFLKVSQNFAQQSSQTYQLIIDNISTSLASLLKQNKQQLINNNVTCIIPQEFRVIHTKKFDQFYKMNNFQNRKSVLINQTIQLPFRAGNQHVLFLQMSAVLRFDPNSNCAIVQCLLKRITNDAINFIVDLDGNVKYKETLVFEDFVNDPTVKTLLTGMKQKWDAEGNIEEVSMKVQQTQSVYTFICQPLYPHKLKQVGIEPLARVIVKNDNFKTQKMRICNFENSTKFKQVQNGIKQNENDSQASTSSRKDSIENVLSVLTETSSLKTQCFLTITLLLLMIIAILSFNTCINFFNIWSTDVKEQSPTFTVLSLINMKNLFNTAISWHYDLEQAASNTTSNLVDMIYQNQTLTATGLQRLRNLLNTQKTIVNTYLLGTTNEATATIKKAFDTLYQIKNPILDTNKQQMSLQNIVGNFVVDIYTLYTEQPYKQAMLSFAYLPQIYPEFTKIINKTISQLQAEISTIRNNNIIMIIFVSLFLLTFLIPLWKFNVSNKKKHEQIYNLLASLESKFIVDEIRKLSKIQHQVFIYASNTELKEEENITSLFRISGNSKSAQKAEKAKQRNKDFYLILSGVKKITAEEMAQEKKYDLALKVRKRGGQIAIEGSDCDRKKFILSDWVAILFMVLFLAITHVVFWQKLSYINLINENFKLNLYQMSTLQDTSLALLNAKIFTDDYSNNNTIQFEGQDLKDWLKNWIVTYNSSSDYEIPSQTDIKTCIENFLLCKITYSEKVLESIIKMSISNAYQQKYFALQNSNQTDSTFLQKSRFLLFFSQSLMDVLRTNKTDWSTNSFAELQIDQQMQSYKKIVFTSIFWLLVVIFCVFSIFYTIWIKNKYVRQVTLLSILNKQMLYNNKRVESFVHRLSRSSR